MKFVDENKKLKKIIIDLEAYRIDVYFTESREPLSLFFNTSSRQFFCSVIAFVVIEMKRDTNLYFINIRTKPRTEKIRLLDQAISGKNASSEVEQLFDKIRTAWRYRLQNMEKASSFIVTYCSKKMNFDKMDEYSYGYLRNVVDTWPGLFGYDSNKKWHYRFAIENATITLDDVQVVFGKNRDEQAWNIFIKKIENRKGNEKKFEPNISDDYMQLRFNINHFLNEIENQLGYMKFYHIDKKVKINEQYIPINVTPEIIHRYEVENFLNYSDTGEDLKRLYAFKGVEVNLDHSIPWTKAKNEIKNKPKYIIVLGDPGMGKSTLLRMEAKLIAQQESQKLNDNDNSRLDETIFPILLKLNDLSRNEDEIIDAIPKLMKVSFPKISDTITDILKVKLESGNCTLLLDALDEVPTEERNMLSDKLNRFAKNYPCDIICTSRIVGYSGNFIDGAREIEILPFNQEQVKEYVETWFDNINYPFEPNLVAAETMLNELQNKPQMKGLSQNPLLLSFLCALYEEKEHNIPTRRCDVYAKILNYMLCRRGQKRRYQTEARVQAKISMLEELAFHFSCKRNEIFTLEELLKWVLCYLNDGKCLSDFTSADQVVTELSTEDGILVKLERGDNKYIFLHLTIQEYLTASYLKNVYKFNPNRTILSLRKYYWNFDWHETLALLAGLLDNPIPFICDIVNGKDDIFRNLLILAGRCISECDQKSNSQIFRIINQIIELWKCYPRYGALTSVLVSIAQSNPFIIKIISKFIDSEDVSIRSEAIRVLGKICRTECIEFLIQALNNEDFYIRKEAVKAMGKIGGLQCIQPLTKALEDDAGWVRENAAKALKKICGSDIISKIENNLKDKNPSIRMCAAQNLGTMRSSDSISKLIRALRDENKYVKIKVAHALGKIGGAKSIKALIEAFFESVFDKPDMYFTKAVVESLEKIGSEKAVSIFKWALHFKPYLIYRTAAIALGKIGNEESIKVLKNAMRGSDPELIFASAKALCKHGNTESVKILLKTLRHESPGYRMSAAETISQIDFIDHSKLLVDVLRDDDSTVRSKAAEILGEIGSTESKNPLINALRDESYRVRRQAAFALGEIGGDESINPLVEALADEDRIVRVTAATSLRKIGKLEILKKFITSPKIDIYETYNYYVARDLYIRYSKENVEFIPVFPDLVKRYEKSSNDEIDPIVA
jgi:HEAT repeat protein/energy-coupling factor transporter ATP-binding protein EcfA2